jgi:hypothetical protein
MAYVPSPHRPQDAFGNALGNAAIAGIEHVNEIEADELLPVPWSPS